MIQDYMCRPEASDQGIAGLIREYDLPVPEIYKKREQMIKAAVLEREKQKKPFCTLPFDHTLEAENMGGSIRYGNEKAGPRAAAPVCSSLEELSFLSRMDPESGRMAETLAACRILREQGEEVVFQMSGPYTIWNTLIELKQVFKAARKTPEQVEALFQKLEEDLLGLLLEVKKKRCTDGQLRRFRRRAFYSWSPYVRMDNRRVYGTISAKSRAHPWTGDGDDSLSEDSLCAGRHRICGERGDCPAGRDDVSESLHLCSRESPVSGSDVYQWRRERAEKQNITGDQALPE